MGFTLSVWFILIIGKLFGWVSLGWLMIFFMPFFIFILWIVLCFIGVIIAFIVSEYINMWR